MINVLLSLFAVPFFTRSEVIPLCIRNKILNLWCYHFWLKKSHAFQWIYVSSFLSWMVEIIKTYTKFSPVVFHKQHLLRIQQSRRQEKRNRPATFFKIILWSLGVFKQDWTVLSHRILENWKYAQLDVLSNLQMIELQTQSLFVSLERFWTAFVLYSEVLLTVMK